MTRKTFLLLAALLIAVSAPAAAPKASRSTDKISPALTNKADQLIAVLQSGADRKAKADACRQIAVVGDAKAIPPLVGLLADPELNHMARYGLETIPGPDVDAALRDQLSRLHGRQLAGVIGSLGVRRDPRAAKTLSSLLAHPDPEVAQAAAGALGNIGTPAALKSLLAALPKSQGITRLAVAEGCLRATEIVGAKEPNRLVRSSYDRLSGASDLPIQVRVAATRGAILVAGRNTSLLQKALAGEDFQFVAAIRAAMEMPAHSPTPALAAALPRLNTDKKTVVIQTLGALGDPAAVAPLASIARSADSLRVPAIKAIARIGTQEALAVMLELAACDQPDVAQAAKNGLAGLTLPVADDAVLKLMGSPEASARLLGIELAGRRRMRSAMPELFRLAGTADAPVRAAAFRRIGELGGTGQVAQLTGMILGAPAGADLQGPSQTLTRICTQSEKTPALAAQLTTTFLKATPSQKTALLPALQAVGGQQALASVQFALSDPSPDLAKAAFQTLCDWPDPAAAPELLRLASAAPDASGRAVAFRGYMRLVRESDLPASTRLEMLRKAGGVETGPAGQKLILSGLGDIPSVDALKLVAQKLPDPALSEEAAAAAVSIAEKLDGAPKAEARPILEQVARSAKSATLLEKTRKLLQ